MAHLLLIEAPGGNDLTVLEDALALGHQFTFVTSSLGHYQALGAATRALLAEALGCIEIPDFTLASWLDPILALHQAHPVEAVLCLVDIRIVAAAELARRLGCRFLAPAAARLLRDKAAVRERLAVRGVRQPESRLATTPQELRSAVRQLGFPVLVKPADGYASQQVQLVQDGADLEACCTRLAGPVTIDYGLGVRSSQRWSVERYVRGELIGCDLLIGAGEPVFLGINDKRMFAPPSFAMRGSCFPSQRYDTAGIRAYALQLLEAVGFDFGATHIEMIVDEQGLPWMVEINPRLVSAQIPFQLGYAFGRSVHAALIDLHLGRSLDDWRHASPVACCAIRWLVAPRPGVIERIEWPQDAPIQPMRVVVFRGPGAEVVPPINNGDRIAYVMVTAPTQEQAEAGAEAYLSASRLVLR